MVNTEAKPEADHFIMLDVLNTVNRKEFDRSYLYVQLVYPPNEGSFYQMKISEIHPENGLKPRERRKYFFSTVSNIDSDY